MIYEEVKRRRKAKQTCITCKHWSKTEHHPTEKSAWKCNLMNDGYCWWDTTCERWERK